MTDSSESDEFSNSKNIENNSFKRKKKIIDVMAKKGTKIRKTFDNNISFIDAEVESCETSELDTFDSVSNITKIDSVKTYDNNINKKSFSESQCTDNLEELDDLFDEEWDIKKDTEKELDHLFEDDWSYTEKTIIDFTSPKRCTIIDIICEKNELLLTVKDDSNASAILKCIGIWSYTKLEPGEPIVVKAKRESSESKHWTIDNNFGWIINQADTLIAGTSVVGALFCNRRSVFKEKFRLIESLPYYDVGNYFMLTGSLTHELLQSVLEKNITEIKKISALLDDTLKSKHAIAMMYSAGISMTECKNLMRPSVSQIYKFIERYIKGVQPKTSDNNFNGKIEKICDIEENIWIPTLGLKGKIDLTVEVSNKSKNSLISSQENRIIPLELKTGKSSFSVEHQGQLILYIMMMNMTGRKVDSGLLLYLRDNIMREVVGNNIAQRDLITLRNTVAYYTTRQPTVIKIKDKEIILPMDLPKPINHPSCTTCPYNTLCITYLTEEEKKQLDDKHELTKISDKITSHLTKGHIDYVMNWVSLLQLEETACFKDISWKDVWTMKPSKREERGSCITNLKLISVSEDQGRYLHYFEKLEKDREIPIICADFCEQDYVIISTNDRINICSGFIANIFSYSVSVHSEKDLTKVYKNTSFYIDKSFTSSLVAQDLSNLGGLLDDHEVCSKLRKIIIEKQPATFKTEVAPSVLEIGSKIFDKLNKNQVQAILKTLSADDYILIKGFPGTGKTQTLVSLIELLVKLNKSVLVTAHTNTAVDNILLKLLDRNVDFIRFGSKVKTHPALYHKLDDVVTAKCDSPESLHTVYCSKKIVGVTCYGTTHPHFARRKFDICIIDESTQVQQPTILRPLYCASKFILVGDPEQLPPIVRNNTARKLEINGSMFSRLDSKNNTVILSQQYRMNNCIMNLANKLTYHEHLQMGNESVKNATLEISNVKEFESCEKWVRKALSLRLKNSAIMLNTSATYHLTFNSTQFEKKGVCNYWEAAIIKRLIDVLLHLGVDPHTVGIIAPYRSQVSLLMSLMPNQIEVNTVDQYQGRDKKVIIYSCTKSISKDTNIQEFDILKDHQRLTVAVTRAKHKLIIVGDITTLRRFTPFFKLIEILNHEHIYDLKDGEDDFCFNDLIRLLYNDT